MTSSPSPVVSRTPQARRTLVAACVGNAMEWYDFAIYGAVAVVVTPLFIPSDDSGTILLAAFALYATAFVVRPLGAIGFGRWSDTRGRWGVFVLVLMVMTLATTAVGLLPVYTAVGVVAPVLLLLLRAVQGLAAGGELGLAAVYIAESAPSRRRGAFCAWHTATLALGLAAGLGVGGLVSLLPSDQVAAGWWRAPFLLALPLGLTSLYLRLRGRESELFLAATRGPRAGPVRAVLASHRRAVLTGFAVVAAGSLAFNTFFVYIPNHLVATTDRTPAAALAAAVVGLLAAAGATLSLGALSDRWGRRPVVMGSAAALALGAAPLVLVAHHGSLTALVLAEVVAGAAVGGLLSVSMLAEMFPTAVRGTGLGMTAGLATAFAGGTAPLVDQLLVLATGVEVAPGVYVAGVAALAFGLLRGWPETAFRPLS